VTFGAVSLAIPCRVDEPSLGRTLASAWEDLDRAGVSHRTLLCLNGPRPSASAARRDLDAAARGAGRPVVAIDTDAGGGSPGDDPRAVVVLETTRTGKAIAWNLLRAAVATDIVLFLDADVALEPGTMDLLLHALAAAPSATLASPKTTCAPRATAFEGIMAAPYGVDFPNLSGQLYAARMARLPAKMPEDLIEPERWLELEVGRDALVREPRARVVVRLPATLRDFYRQRIRIEMGKVQLEREYPELARRGTPQPRLRAALRSLGAADWLRLGLYLALRESAHVVARRRYRPGAVAEAWVQAASTKQWTG
jgi:hypothetical protein